MKHLFSVLYMLVHLGPFALLRYYPFRSQLRITARQLTAVYATLICIQAAAYVYLVEQPFWNETLTQLYRMSCMVFFAVLSFLLVRENFFKQLYIWLLTFAVAGVFWTNALFVEARFFSHISADLPHAVSVCLVLLQIALTFPTILRLIDRRLIPVLRSAEGDIWNIIWPVPVLILGGTYFATWELKLTVVSSLFYLIIRLLCFTCMIFYSLIVAETLRKTAENAELRENVMMTDRQLLLERDHYQMLKEHIEVTRRNHHDLRHHLSVFRRHIEGGELQKLREYLDQLERTIPPETSLFFCANSAVNALVSHYHQLAVAEAVSVDLALQLPEKTGIQDADLCIVFGNLLENALEACRIQKESQRFMTVNSVLRGSKLMITVDNSYESPVNQQGIGFLSSKRMGPGVGTSSVQAVARKYGGLALFEYEGGVFRASVMLPGALINSY